MDNKKRYTLRIDPELLEKYHYIVESEARSVNKQLVWYITRSIQAYEKENGPIRPEDLERFRKKKP